MFRFMQIVSYFCIYVFTDFFEDFYFIIIKVKMGEYQICLYNTQKLFHNLLVYLHSNLKLIITIKWNL